MDVRERPELMAICDKFYTYCKAAGLNNNEAAKRIGCHPSTVWRWQNGEAPCKKATVKAILKLTDGAVDFSPVLEAAIRPAGERRNKERLSLRVEDLERRVNILEGKDNEN